MKNINEFITINEDNKNPELLNDSNSIKNGLIVKLDLMNIDSDTLEELFHDMNIDWSLLSRDELEMIYDRLEPDLSFEEWLENNGF